MVNGAPRLLTATAAVLALALLFGACAGEATENGAATTEQINSSTLPEAGGTSSVATTAGEPGNATTAAAAETSEQRFPDVVAAELHLTGGRTFTVSATLSSPYDTPERYADAWRVLDGNGTELGIRELGHDHQNEQPFTRTLSGVDIPEGVTEVTIEGRDQVYGWGGDTVTVAVPQ